MNITLIIKFSGLMLVLLLQSQVMAANHKSNAINAPVKLDSTIPSSTESYSSLNLSQELGLSALIMLTKDEKNDDGEQQELAQLFSAGNTKSLQRHINNSFQTGLYSLKNSYILSPTYTPLLSTQLLFSNVIENDLYQLGRLSTETGYSQQEQWHQKRFKTFIHSTYNVLHRGRFDLSLTASFESTQVQHNLAPVFEPYNKTQNNNQTISTTLGIIGSFDLTEHWSVIGAFTASQINNEQLNSDSQQKHQRNIAIIGTTYSF